MIDQATYVVAGDLDYLMTGITRAIKVLTLVEATEANILHFYIAVNTRVSAAPKKKSNAPSRCVALDLTLHNYR